MSSFNKEAVVQASMESAVRAVYKTLRGKEIEGLKLKYFLRGKKTVTEIINELLKWEGTEIEEYQNTLSNPSTALPLSLVIFAKNNEDSIHLPIESVKHLVAEIIVVDTGSTDATPAIAKSLGARVYNVGFTDFGSIRTVTSHLATQEWVLGLDSDEILAPEELEALAPLLSDPHVDAWGLPRRRWKGLERTNQVELEAYPDYQYRLIRNVPSKYRYIHRVHESLVFYDGHIKEASAPHIEHFQDSFKQGKDLSARNKIYRGLYALDLEDGIVRDVPPVVQIDSEDGS